MTMMQALRTETRVSHAQLEALPYFAALATRTLDLTSYVGHLRALAIVHGALEHELLRTDHAAIASVWRPELAATELLERDLAGFRARSVPDVPGAIDEALGLVANVRARRVADPVSLLGYLYVLEGSRLGAPTVRDLVASALRLDEGTGLAYLSARGAALDAWSTFGARMNAAVTDSATSARLVAAARELFEGLAGVFRCLHPVTETRFTVSALNPEAGAHPVPQDPREINAALRAGEACWNQFAYFEQRYGARGKRFTRSDSAWLATLADLEPEQVRAQVRWLAGVLAARGMPTLLLQRHLELLAQELCVEVPGRAPEFEKLVAAARELAETRLAAIPHERAATLAAGFEAAAGPDATARLPRVGELLVAAVQDEKAGVRGAVASLEGWLVEPSRFAAGWIDAVRATLAEAQGAPVISNAGTSAVAVPGTMPPAR